ncbi:hypothetical protein [Acidomonas methanolica]|uniref:hypothetical protein n=1 Tax=Acidomonas methanolica TaxID=437 RepID=UPI001C043967|nr:hypothetical protein [Acidomonas methanolica]MBU2654612.1 hypothetical protein [Acidomonas methanolica]
MLLCAACSWGTSEAIVTLCGRLWPTTRPQDGFLIGQIAGVVLFPLSLLLAFGWRSGWSGTIALAVTAALLLAGSRLA